MGFAWRQFGIPRFLGLDLKTNVVDVRDGRSLGCENVYQNGSGKMTLRRGNEPMFATDEAGTVPNNGVGSATLAGQKYWFKFSGGDFHYSTTLTGAVTMISPSPAISTTEDIWFAVLDEKLFFVDGTNSLRFFDGTAIKDSAIYSRPTAPFTSVSGGIGPATFTYLYTVDNGLGESPGGPIDTANAQQATVRVPANTGPQTLIAGDVVRIYSRADTIAAASKLVATHTWTGANVTAGFADIGPTAIISEDQPQLYTELGVAVNKTAPVGLVGITVHAGRLVGWKDYHVHNSKVTNPHSWPDDSAQKEAFVYGFGVGDGENITVCVSFRDSLFVLKPSDAAVFGGIGPDDTGNNAYSFRRMEVNGRGCIAGKSAVVIGEEDGNYLIWLSRYGFMASDYGKPIFLGEEIESQIQGQPDNVLSLSCGYHDKKLGLYICYVGSTLSRVAWALDVRKEVGEKSDSGRVGWFKFTNITAMHLFYDTDRALFGLPSGVCLSERVTGTTTDFQDTCQEYVLTSAVNDTTDEITVTEVYATGTPIKVRSSGTVPGGLTANTTYFVINVSNTVIKLATTAALATAGTPIDITNVGTGTHSLVSGELIPNFYTTNWINHGSGLVTKKLMKPGFVFNTVAQSINMNIEAAYDYVNTFQDSIIVDISSSNPWGSNTWGYFTWGSGASADPRNIGQPRRKVKSIRYRFSVQVINQDYELLGMEQPYANIRNRGGYS